MRVYTTLIERPPRPGRDPVFMQNWRAMCVPAPPCGDDHRSLRRDGALGFTVNISTLFAIVLAIGSW